MKVRSAVVLMLLVSCSIVISHSAIAGDGFTQYFYGPTKIIKKGNQLPETENKGFDQHFYGETSNNGETTNIGKKDAIVVDIKSIPDWILIKEVKRRGLLVPVLTNCFQKNSFFSCTENELCY